MELAGEARLPVRGVSPHRSEEQRWAQRDLNPRPPVCKTGALPTELYARTPGEPTSALAERREDLLVLAGIAGVPNPIHD